MISVENLKFDENGLIPAVVVDHYTKEVLTLAYMNRESLEITMQKGLTCFYSRSRKKLWLKGETSGNFQHVVSLTADCDADALVVEVVKDGPACHTGSESCFFNPVWHSDTLKDFSYDGLYELVKGRKTNPQEGSYTTYLFQKGIDKILKKSARSAPKSSSAQRMPAKRKPSLKSPTSPTTSWSSWRKWASPPPTSPENSKRGMWWIRR